MLHKATVRCVQPGRLAVTRLAAVVNCTVTLQTTVCDSHMQLYGCEVSGSLEQLHSLPSRLCHSCFGAVWAPCVSPCVLGIRCCFWGCQQLLVTRLESKSTDDKLQYSRRV